MTAVTFPLRPPRLAFAICGWRWQNDVHEIKYSVCVHYPLFFERTKEHTSLPYKANNEIYPLRNVIPRTLTRRHNF